MRVYQIVTKDKYRLPIAQADTIRELAEMIGKPYQTVRKAITRAMCGKAKNTRYTWVDI